jgi:DNA-binding response OmpR family regulator
MKILIIEDSKMINKLLHKELTSLGFEVEQAHTLKEGWELIENNNFDLIILDLHLPDGEGIELLDELHSMSDAKVIVLSSVDDKSLREELFRYGILDYIIKDKNLKFSVLELIKVIKSASEGNKGEILIIDDSKFLCKQLKNILTPRNYNVQTAYTFNDGIALLNKNKFDLLILDLNLPDGHGVEILEKVRENSNTLDLPVIVLSGEANPDLIREVLKKGANDYLSKPFVFEEFLLRVDLWIEYYKNKKELKNINENLQEIVKQEIEKNRKKDKMLMMQSRHAQLGEILSIISHEWIQPVNAISSLAAIIQLNIIKNGNTDPEFCENTAKKIKKYVQNLSETMYSFKNFFKPQTETQTTNFKKIIDYATSLLESFLQTNQANIRINAKSIENFNAYENELVQVVINIIKNAVEAYGDKTEKTIDITIENKKLTIQDYAGGIPDDVLENIFNQYFSTKGENGTGIGLYMSKYIIEEHCGGTIKVENIGNGAKFEIILN